MKISDLTKYLETLAPLSLQENYDNAGLLVGDANTEVKAVLVSLDSTEDVVDEAIALGSNLIVAHHPIIFSGLKKINGKNYVERTVIKAIKNDVALYAMHTNLDNVAEGVNKKIAEQIGLKNARILSPKNSLLKKLVTFVPVQHLEKVQQALFDAGAGQIGNYSACGFNAEGIGTFNANENAKPFVGQKGELHSEKETRFETIFPAWLQEKIIAALKSSHPYEEVAFDIYPLENNFNQVGSGMIGELETAMKPMEFLSHLKTNLELEMIRYTPIEKAMKTVAICGGAGSFLLKNAIAAGADAFVTADFKYHEFFDAENKLMIADVGHFESEKFTKELIADLIIKKFPTFAVHLSKVNTNPIKYFY